MPHERRFTLMKPVKAPDEISFCASDMSLEYDVNNANLFGILVRPALENGPVVIGTMLACVVIQQLAHILSPFFFKTYGG